MKLGDRTGYNHACHQPYSKRIRHSVHTPYMYMETDVVVRSLDGLTERMASLSPSDMPASLSASVA